MAGEWIVRREESQYPAAGVATLQQWAMAGSIRPADQVWSPVRGEWSAATATPEIASLLVRTDQLIVAPSALSPVANASAVAVAATAVERRPATMVERFFAYIIDVLPAAAIAVIGIVPLIGHIVAGLLLGFYWLYRDVSKFSLGKMALGLEAVQVNGEPAAPQPLKRRNLPLAVPAFITAIPIVGLVLGPVAAMLALAANAVVVMTEGRTLGDKMAGTTVVKRS